MCNLTDKAVACLKMSTNSINFPVYKILHGICIYSAQSIVGASLRVHVSHGDRLSEQ